MSKKDNLPSIWNSSQMSSLTHIYDDPNIEAAEGEEMYSSLEFSTLGNTENSGDKTLSEKSSSSMSQGDELPINFEKDLTLKAPSSIKTKLRNKNARTKNNTGEISEKNSQDHIYDDPNIEPAKGKEMFSSLEFNTLGNRENSGDKTLSEKSSSSMSQGDELPINFEKDLTLKASTPIKMKLRSYAKTKTLNEMLLVTHNKLDKNLTALHQKVNYVLPTKSKNSQKNLKKKKILQSNVINEENKENELSVTSKSILKKEINKPILTDNNTGEISEKNSQDKSKFAEIRFSVPLEKVQGRGKMENHQNDQILSKNDITLESSSNFIHQTGDQHQMKADNTEFRTNETSKRNFVFNMTDLQTENPSGTWLNILIPLNENNGTGTANILINGEAMSSRKNVKIVQTQSEQCESKENQESTSGNKEKTHGSISHKGSKRYSRKKRVSEPKNDQKSKTKSKDKLRKSAHKHKQEEYSTDSTSSDTSCHCDRHRAKSMNHHPAEDNKKTAGVYMQIQM